MSNYTYNGDPTNHPFMGGHPHGQSTHHNQQQHGMHAYHSHLATSAMPNSNSHPNNGAQIHSPSNMIMNNALEMTQQQPTHRPASYGHTFSSQIMNQPAFPYNHNHLMNHHHQHHHHHQYPPSHHSLIHQASSSSLSTMSISNPGMSISSQSKPFIGGNNSNQILVHDHDVLSGRGVNIAQHPGNQRFRTLITTFRDQEYCTSYSASEKKAVALQIIQHIKKLDPPGRFLRRDGRGQGIRGLNGPWDELSERDAIKKTCQALRDCNRQDRQGYAKGVAAPGDVVKVVEEVSHIPPKDRAVAAAIKIATEARSDAFKAISVAANSSRGAIYNGHDYVNETSSTVSMPSSTKRSRDQEGNSSTTATTMAETIDSANINFSTSAYHNLNHINAPNSSILSSRYSPALGAFSTSNYMPGSTQGAGTYQYQQHQRSSPYQQMHPRQNHSSSYMSNFGGPNSQNNGSYPSATSASASYFHANSSNPTSDHNSIMPVPGPQAQLSQEGMLGAPNSNTYSNNTHSHLLHHHNQQQPHNYYTFPNAYNENNLQQYAPSFSIANVGALEDQMIKKQRTEDTEVSTGPSEPSPLNGDGSHNHNNSNGGKNTIPPNGYDQSAQNPSIANINNRLSSLPPQNGSSGIGIKKEMNSIPSETMKNDGDDNFFDAGEGENAIDNDCWGDSVERNNTSSIQGNDQFQDALGQF